ncbi:hypothetical protein ACFU8W_34910 [Streptomyces sp. NPDC057565]|uniref:hypothetical protein n=1 Tax=Streptomyces sp. NPDC057565 TaxID=3346169 RepID=UPI0036AE108A
MFALVGTALGLSAHHLVAEGPAPWLPGLVAAAVLFGVGLVGTRRPRTLTTMVGACGAAQAGLHVWLAVTHPHQTATAMPTDSHHVMNVHEAWHERLHSSVTMIAVHAAAAVLVAVLLHRADTVCWSLARGFATAVDAVRARIATAGTLLVGRPPLTHSGLVTLVHAWLERPRIRGAMLADAVVRRGPPQAGFGGAI